jgi:hypothetical protein
LNQLLDLRERLTPADHQTHRRYTFEVPSSCTLLHIHVSYAPKMLSVEESAKIVQEAIRSQAGALESRVGPDLADAWSHQQRQVEWGQILNLVTISVDDAAGGYRGACHREAPDQQLMISEDSASPGLVAGPLPEGTWTLTLSAHTLASPQCDVSIQIGAETASNRP